ncbi:MAG: glycogen debranching enzyme family protein, partial [Verrucomicrobia bacterium]|nr:glycogen debranching enzyme family protein [Verrucomicrobiota bacterium]
MINLNASSEWLEADGLGGFASGTAVGVRTRRYHALLLVASNPPSGRLVLVNGFDAWLTIGDRTTSISSQRYAPDVTYPDGAGRLKEFQLKPWPSWKYQVAPDLFIEQQIFVPYSKPAVILRWSKVGEWNESLVLNVRPFLSGRDYHSLHHQNAAFNFDAQQLGRTIKWQPYHSLPRIIACSNGHYRHMPDWYHNFLYEQERERGLDYTEDLATPGIFKWDLTERSGLLVLSTSELVGADQNLEDVVAETEFHERTRRSRFHDRLEQSVDSYLVKRGAGKTIIAGYPWFGDWGRDTFISLRGLCLRTGRLTEARDILVEWSHSVSNGMLPNRFPDKGEIPEFNSVDASLWYIIAVDDYLRSAAHSSQLAAPDVTAQLEKAINAILTGYLEGTRYGIHADSDA